MMEYQARKKKFCHWLRLFPSHRVYPSEAPFPYTSRNLYFFLSFILFCRLFVHGEMMRKQHQLHKAESFCLEGPNALASATCRNAAVIG